MVGGGREVQEGGEISMPMVMLMYGISFLAWEIPWMEEPGGLQFKELQKGQTQPSTHAHTYVHMCIYMYTHKQIYV